MDFLNSHSSTIFLGVWTLVSTPTAELQYVRSKNHWVCQTGGFTGSPGGYVFFFVLVGALVRRFAFSLSLSLSNSLSCRTCWYNNTTGCLAGTRLNTKLLGTKGELQKVYGRSRGSACSTFCFVLQLFLACQYLLIHTLLARTDLQPILHVRHRHSRVLCAALHGTGCRLDHPHARHSLRLWSYVVASVLSVDVACDRHRSMRHQGGPFQLQHGLQWQWQRKRQWQ